MPSYKLSYFNIRVRAETARMLFKLGGQEFEDNRLDRAKWPELKKTMPMGQVPILEVDGVRLCQSNAINRYLAREFGFAGKDTLSQARVDMIVDCLEEPSLKVQPVFRAPNDEVKAAEGKKYREETLIPALEKFTALLEDNNGGNGYFVGDSLTFADLILVNITGFCMIMAQEDLWSKYPKLNALKQRVESNPKIAAWIKERPVTPV